MPKPEESTFVTTEDMLVQVLHNQIVLLWCHHRASDLNQSATEEAIHETIALRERIEDQG